MSVFGSLKTNKLRLQGHGPVATDYSIEVSEDMLHMKMGDESVLTIAPDNDDVAIQTTDSDKHHLEISKDAIFKKDVHVEGSKLCIHGNFEMKDNSRLASYNEYDTSRSSHESMMGMSHMDHMIGNGFFSGTQGGDDEMLIALEFCHKMQPHHQEAVDTGRVMYKWAADGAVGHLGFHLQYWQQIEIDRQSNIGLNIVNYIQNKTDSNGQLYYSQAIRDKVSSLIIEFKRVAIGSGTHMYNKETDVYEESAGGEYSRIIENYTNPPTYKKYLKYWPEYKRMMNEEFYIYNYPGPDFLYPQLELNFLRDMILQNEGGHMMIESMLQNMNTQFHSAEVMATGEYIPGSASYCFKESVKVMDLVDKALDGVTITDENDLAKLPKIDGLLDTVNREYKIYFGEIPFLKELVQTICTRNKIVADAGDHGTDHGADNGSSQMTTYIITSGMANGAHKFLMDGEYKSMVHINKGTKVKFDQSDVSNCGPLGISTLADGRMNGMVHEMNDHNDGVMYFVDGNEVTKDDYKQMFTMHTNRYMTFQTSNATPMNLYYYCKNMANMGGMLHVM